MCGKKTIESFSIQTFVPKDGLAIVCESKNQKKFQLILEKLKQIETYSEIGEGNVRFSMVHSSIKEAYKLFDCMSSLGSPNNECFVYENGKKLRSYGAIHDSKFCYARRIACKMQEYYCFGAMGPQNGAMPNLIGCYQVYLEISPYSGVYSQGEWQDIFGNYVFDKERMIDRATKRIKQYRFCPFINEDLIYKFIDLWPKEVNVYLDPQWKCYPPQQDSSPEIIDVDGINIVININIDKKYQVKLPLVTDMNFFVDLVKKLYPENTSENVLAGVKASINIIQEQVSRIYNRKEGGSIVKCE